MNAKTFLLLVLCLFSVAFVFLGLYDRNVVLNANPCKMTYTSKDKSLIKLEFSTSFKLWKISNPKSNKMNPQPVLFVPGHFGSVDQVRSFASHMHNSKDYFQYFSVDFHGESSAFHGSDVLSQAAFTNEALNKINSLYNMTSSSTKGIKIIVLAHSLGGMVARTAAVLSNHPKCVVSDIVMLGSPNNKSPYTPDPSMEMIFSSVNKAWLLSFYNTSKACQTSSVMAGLAPSQGLPLSADYLCPICAPKIRLTSISGGDIDLHVSPSLAQLHEIASRPRNMSLEVVKQRGGVGIMGRVTQIKGLISRLLSSYTVKVVHTLGDLFGSGTVANATAQQDVIEINDESISTGGDVQQCDTTVNGTCIDTSVAGPETPTSPISSSSSGSSSGAETQFSFITKDNWEHHIMPYIEPQFLSVRTSQLQGVGFPIDHTAMLWCHQLLQVVSRGMETLSRVDPGDLSLDLADVFPIVGQSAVDSAMQAVRDIDIDQLSRFVSRNESMHAFRSAGVDEAAYVKKILGGNWLRALAVTYVTKHFVQIAVCYLLVSCLTVAGGLLRALGGHAAPSPIATLGGLSLILPWNHLSLDLLYPAFLNLLQQSGLPLPAIPPLLTLVGRAVPVVVLSKALYDWQFNRSFTVVYSNILFWIVSYGVALVLRALLLAIIYSLRFVTDCMYTLLRATLRLTVWNQFVRRSVRKGVKVLSAWTNKIPAIKAGVAALRSSFVPLMLLSLWVSIYVKTSSRVGGTEVALGSTTYGLSIISIVAYVAVVFVVVAAVLFCPYDSKTDRQLYSHFTEFTLLYLPVPILAWPSFLFAVRLLYGQVDQFHTAASLYGIFGPERIHYCLCLVFVALHLWRVRLRENSIEIVGSLTWLEDMVGPRALLAATNVSPDSSTTGMFSAFKMSTIRSSSAACVHEDGGSFAVFEKIEPENVASEDLQVKEVAVGVSLGSTYRVVHCACAKDTKLKFQSEWCEWCLCRKCGGKHLPVDRNAYGSDRNNVKDFSVDLLLLLAFYGIVGLSWMYVVDRPYLYLYFIGLVAVAHFVANVAKVMNFST